MATESTLVKHTERPLSEQLEERVTVAPAVDIYENEEELRLVADVPGVGKEDVHISFEKDRLSLQAARSTRNGYGVALSAEYRPIDYRREFLVPRGIDIDRIEATVESGVLTVRLPKAAGLRPRQIPIKTG